MLPDDLNRFIAILPPRVRPFIEEDDDLVEVVLDLGRPLEIRYQDRDEIKFEVVIGEDDLRFVEDNVSPPGPDNRSGIDGTLHRISRIVNRAENLVGYTARVGRTVPDAALIMKDLLDEELNILILGKPGSGKTTKLRDVAQHLSNSGLRVVIVDSSNEIAGDGDVPHKAVGRARRLQVPPRRQLRDVMIEAVENHTPDVIIVDEISTKEEAEAARSIAMRGVQLIATAHGDTIEELMRNWPLSGLIGGIKTVTLTDEEAKRRESTKTVQEREMEPIFSAIVELVEFDIANVHKDVSRAIDVLLRGGTIRGEERRILAGEMKVVQPAKLLPPREVAPPLPNKRSK